MSDTRGHVNDTSHVSYINDLPVELLEEIFWHFVGDSKHHHSSYGGPLSRQNDNAYQIPPYRKPYGDPILLGTVCNRWRNIALTIPGLWSTIYLNTDHPHASHRLSLYLSRCESEALTLSFMARKIRIPTTYALEQGARLSCLARYGELFANVLSLVPRCRRLYLDLHWQLQHSEAVAYLQHYNPANPSILEELSATFAGGWDARKATNFFAYLQSSPALKNIRVKGLSGNINLTATQKLLQTLNTTSLHNVELDDFHRFDQLLPFLEKCDSLEQFSCSVANPPPPSMALVLYGSNTTPSSSSSTVLGRLHTLSLLSLSALDHLFKPLVLPSLRHLKVEHCWDMSSSDGSPYIDVGWDSLRDMLERSQCQLTSLEYIWQGDELQCKTPAFSESSLVRFLRSPCSQWLEELRITAGVGDELLQALVYKQGKASACPGLKRLEVKGCRSTDGMWSDMVLSRSRGPTRLESAFVLLRGHSESDYTKDRMLVVPGMNLEASWKV